jgi:hypothetical protein
MVTVAKPKPPKAEPLRIWIERTILLSLTSDAVRRGLYASECRVYGTIEPFLQVWIARGP